MLILKIDPNFLQVFLLTYRQFITSKALIDLLVTRYLYNPLLPLFIFDIFDVKRYNIPEPTGIKEEELDNFRKTVVLPVRLRYSPISLSLFPYVLPSLLPPLSFPYTLHRIYNLVKHWISRHWVDFDDNPEMITLLRQFIKRMKETDQVNNAVNLEKLLKKMVVLFSFFL